MHKTFTSYAPVCNNHTTNSKKCMLNNGLQGDFVCILCSPQKVANDVQGEPEFGEMEKTSSGFQCSKCKMSFKIL